MDRSLAGDIHEIYVRKNGEVILSAVAIGSPQLLLLSGLGPTSYLSPLNIPVVRDHPFVGQFMADYQRTGVNILIPDAITKAGLRVAGIIESGPYIESISIPPNTPLTNFIPSLGLVKIFNSSVQTIAGKVTRPVSTGSLYLLSASNVTVSPSVCFNYYNHTEDVYQCWNALEVVRKLLATQTMEEYKYDGQSFRFVGLSLPEESSDYETIASFCSDNRRII